MHGKFFLARSVTALQRGVSALQREVSTLQREVSALRDRTRLEHEYDPDETGVDAQRQKPGRRRRSMKKSFSSFVTGS